MYPFMIIFIIISTVIISVLTYVSWRKYKAMKQQEKERHR
ncbi:sporulation protein YpjB [Pseudogracilibacillus sp. ICA-222130]